jgi:nucleotide-binding universal stress UspA family protein
MEFRNILFPVDFSEACEAIVPHVRALCERFQASLTLAHFVYIPATSYGALDASGPFLWPVQELTENAERRLRTFSARFFSGLNPQIVVREGDAGACISHIAASHPFDLVMMPTHGYGRFRTLLLGSVAGKTLHDATCAVWTAAHNAKQRPAEPWKRILCAIDSNEEGTALLGKAAELSENGKISVRVIHVVPSLTPAEDPSIDSGFSEFLIRSGETAIAHSQAAAGTAFEVRIKMGVIPELVRKEAVDWDADVVLIGRGLLPRFAGQFRSHAYSIIRTMPCPVLSV